jgi:hypothetical protein
MELIKDERVSDIFLITKKFNTSTEFSQHIEKQTLRTGLSHMDVLVDYCERNEIEIESVNKLLSTSLKEKIKNEALDLNMLKEKKSNELPLD